MTEPAPTAFDVRANFDDGSSRSVTMMLDTADGENSSLERELSISVAGTPEDADAYANVVTSLRYRVDELMASATPEVDVDKAIDEAARQLLGLQHDGVSAAQRRKFDEFMTHPQRDNAARAVRAYVAAVGDALDADALGTHWGVTVPGKATLLRVNVGITEVFTAREDGTTRLYLQGDPPHGALPSGSVLLDGLATAPPNYGLKMTVDDAISMLNSERTLTAARARVENVWRPLIQPNFHNPLTEQLL